MRSRALWRLGRTGEAEAELALAATEGGPGAEELVAYACEDLAQYLVLSDSDKDGLRRRIGCGVPPVSELRQGIEAEEAGRLDEAHERFIANLRDAQSRGSSIQIALAMHELGRFAAMYGSQEEATYWLRQRLSQGVRLDLDPAPVLRLLGLSAERAEKFDEAAHWLADAAAASRRSRDERGYAEVLYELALVHLQSSQDLASCREEFLEAYAIFDRTGPRVHAGDCWLMIAQLETVRGDRDAVCEAAECAKAIYAGCGAEGERILALERILAEGGCQS